MTNDPAYEAPELEQPAEDVLEQRTPQTGLAGAGEPADEIVDEVADGDLAAQRTAVPDPEDPEDPDDPEAPGGLE